MPGGFRKIRMSEHQPVARPASEALAKKDPQTCFTLYNQQANAFSCKFA